MPETCGRFGKGDEPARWNVELKRRPLSARYVAAILGGVTAFVGVPYAEEFVRCYRVDRTLAPHKPEEGDPPKNRRTGP